MGENINRAFMYGESVFTTMRLVDGVLCDWEYHFERLKQGIEFVYGPFSEREDWAVLFKDACESKCQNESGNKVIRLTIYSEAPRGPLLKLGFMSITALRIHLSSSAFDINRVEVNNLKLRTCPALLNPHWWPSFLKAGNYLGSILSQKIFLKPGDDDILFLSPDDTILESSVANIFVVRHNRLYTPPTGPNVLSGIMRRKVLEVALDYFDDCQEADTSMEQVYKADAIFGSNSVRGLFLIDQIDDYEIRHGIDFLPKFKALRARVYE